MPRETHPTLLPSPVATPVFSLIPALAEAAGGGRCRARRRGAAASLPRCDSDGARCRTSHLARHHVSGDCAALGSSCWRTGICISGLAAIGFSLPSSSIPPLKIGFGTTSYLKRPCKIWPTCLPKEHLTHKSLQLSPRNPVAVLTAAPLAAFSCWHGTGSGRDTETGDGGQRWQLNAACGAVLKPPQLLRLQFCELDLRRPLPWYLSLCPGAFYILICF